MLSTLSRGMVVAFLINTALAADAPAVFDVGGTTDKGSCFTFNLKLAVPFFGGVRHQAGRPLSRETGNAIATPPRSAGDPSE
jgi:hypothetical protein